MWSTWRVMALLLCTLLQAQVVTFAARSCSSSSRSFAIRSASISDRFMYFLPWNSSSAVLRLAATSSLKRSMSARLLAGAPTACKEAAAAAGR